MSTINTIVPNLGNGAGNSLTSQGNSLVQPGLMGFMNMLLTPVSGMPATGQTLLGMGDVQQLVEKIAASLNLDPSDPSALLQILQQAKLQAEGDITPTLMDDGQAIKPTLTSDLTAALAADLQANDKDALQASADMTELAALMNQMEPGATGAALDPDVLNKLKELFQSFIAGSADMNKEQLALLKKQATEFLRAQGIADQDINQYLASMAVAFKVDLAIDQSAPGQNNTAAEEPVRALQEAVTKNHEASAKGLQDAKALEKAPAEKPASQRTDSPAPAPADKPAAKAASNAGTAASLAMVNAFASDDRGFAGGLPASDVAAAAVMHADTGAQNVTNYMNTAKTVSAQMTQMISLQIQKNAAANVNTFTMHLNPAELGRLDVQMKFAKDGTMKAHLTAERPETLSMLQRDQQQLNRILEQAGLNVDENSLSFDLRQQNPNDFGGYMNDGTRTGRNDVRGFGDNNNAVQAQLAIEAAGYISQTGVNIVV